MIDKPLLSRGAALHFGPYWANTLGKEGLKIDVAFTSFLKRAIKTCNLALEAADQLYVPQNKSWRLNERMYGGLTGLDKKDRETRGLFWSARRHGQEPPTCHLFQGSSGSSVLP